MIYPTDQDPRKGVEGIAMIEIGEMIEEGGEVIAVEAMVIAVEAMVVVVVEVVLDMVIGVVMASEIEVAAVEIVEGTEEVMPVVMRIARDLVKMVGTMVSFPSNIISCNLLLY